MEDERVFIMLQQSNSYLSNVRTFLQKSLPICHIHGCVCTLWSSSTATECLFVGVNNETQPSCLCTDDKDTSDVLTTSVFHMALPKKGRETHELAMIQQLHEGRVCHLAIVTMIYGVQDELAQQTGRAAMYSGPLIAISAVTEMSTHRIESTFCGQHEVCNIACS